VEFEKVVVSIFLSLVFFPNPPPPPPLFPPPPPFKKTPKTQIYRGKRKKKTKTIILKRKELTEELG